MRKIKMIALDLDGTLLRDNKSLSRRSRKAIAAAIEQGIIVLVATGRSYTGVPQELREFPGMRYMLSSNGSRVFDCEQNEVIYESLIPKETASAVLDVFDKYDSIQEIYFDGIGYAMEQAIKMIYDYMDNPDMAKYILSTRKPVKNIRKKMAEMNGSLDKVQALFRNLEEKEKAVEDLKGIPDIEVTGAISNNIEVNNKGVNKGLCLVRLGKMLGISREEIMACGDGQNDLEMMREVGFAVAMNNADDMVKAEADYITGTNEEDGVAQAIEKFVLHAEGR